MQLTLHIIGQHLFRLTCIWAVCKYQQWLLSLISVPRRVCVCVTVQNCHLKDCIYKYLVCIKSKIHLNIIFHICVFVSQFLSNLTALDYNFVFSYLSYVQYISLFGGRTGYVLHCYGFWSISDATNTSVPFCVIILDPSLGTASVVCVRFSVITHWWRLKSMTLRVTFNGITSI
jgi:hypothetical protein